VHLERDDEAVGADTVSRMTVRRSAYATCIARARSTSVVRGMSVPFTATGSV
jgi:hypothetical protein